MGENINLNKIENMMANGGTEDKTTAIVHYNAANINLASSLSDKGNPYRVVPVPFSLVSVH